MPSCDCHRTTMWRTKSSTAQQSSPTLDMGLIACTYFHLCLIFTALHDKILETERKMKGKFWTPRFYQHYCSPGLQNNQLMKITLRSCLSDYLHPSSFLCTSLFFESILSLYLSVSRHIFSWLHHLAAWAARLTRITNVHVALVFLWCHKWKLNWGILVLTSFLSVLKERKMQRGGRSRKPLTLARLSFHTTQLSMQLAG